MFLVELKQKELTFYVRNLQFFTKSRNLLRLLTLWPFFMDGVQLPQGYSHFEEAVYFLPLSSKKFLALILSTSEG